MGTTYQIPPPRWRDFFDTLNQLYLGWQLGIEVLDQELGDQVIGERMILQGFSFDSRRPDADLVVEGGDPQEPLLVHYVRHPRSVWMTETDLGAEADIQVESEDKTTTLLRLRRLPALPAATSGRRRASASRGKGKVGKGKARKARSQATRSPRKKKKPTPLRGTSRR